MNSNVDKLYNMINELSEYKREKNKLLPMYVNLRLNQSLQVYYKEVVDSFNYLKYKNELRLARKLNKYERNR